ncbi:MAG: rhodanese-like domain-containing protein [Campylobacterota bacterium]|nr:rhodanese-like domain-containing protein [Campylobacterota bacterium]
MFKKIFLTLALLSSFVFGADGFTTMSTKDVQEAIEKDVVVIDIRRAEEWSSYGTIKGSHKLTFFDVYGRYDINKWMAEFTKLVTKKDQPFILVCAHANRTKVVSRFLGKDLGYTNVNELEGGINYGWIDKGLKVVH